MMFDIEKARQAEELAAQCLSDLCHAKRRWEMHIPLQNDDPDVILGDALGQLRSAIKEIERHRAELAAIPWDAIEKMQGCEAQLLVDAAQLVSPLQERCQLLGRALAAVWSLVGEDDQRMIVAMLDAQTAPALVGLLDRKGAAMNTGQVQS